MHAVICCMRVTRSRTTMSFVTVLNGSRQATITSHHLAHLSGIVHHQLELQRRRKGAMPRCVQMCVVFYGRMFDASCLLCEPLVGSSCSLLLASRGASLVLERYASFRQCKAICRFLLIAFNSLVELFSLNAIRHCGFRLGEHIIITCDSVRMCYSQGG